MLSRLKIENLALVELADLAFKPGMNALTGETGAGKSMIVGALELVLGGRGGADQVRQGAKLAVIEAVIESPMNKPLARLVRTELGIEIDDGEPLTLRREITAQGRSRCLAAGQMIGVADLKRIGELLADLHGQHEHQSLFHHSSQRAALDAHGGHGAILVAYQTAYESFAALRRRREELAAEAADFEKRADYLNFQIQELEEVDPQPGEAAGLEAERARLAHAEQLALAAETAYALLYEGMGEEGRPVIAALGEVRRALDQIARVDPASGELSEKAAEIQALVEDLAGLARDYAAKCEGDPDRLNEVIGRQEALAKLRRKYGARDEDELAEILERMRGEQSRLNLDERERGEIDAKLAQARAEVEAHGRKLTEAREAAAKKMSGEVMKTLAQAAMEKAVFKIEVAPAPEPEPEGADRVEFMLAANPGEGMKPLRDTASGGELSRTMLAIKTALAKRDSIPLLVFDEIDAGISGEAAARVGRLMEKLGASHQIICITHHASIAARAGHHISVRKTTQKGRTSVGVAELDDPARVEELARILSGDAATPEGRKLAEKLMER